jgi:cobalt/nickel transport system permease protein
MTLGAFVALWAIHLPDGILTVPWLAGGFVVAGLLALVGAWRVRDEEIPRIAVMAAAFFVATLIHVPVPGGPKTHLLLNGLLGIVLGPRAAVAIPIGLFLQMALFGHGGFTTLGVNSCVMTIPALVAWLTFAGFERTGWIRHPMFRCILVAGSIVVVLVTAVYSVALLISNPLGQLENLNTSDANRLILLPAVLTIILLLGIAGGWLERRLENRPEFPLGLVIGEMSVLTTVFLNCVALYYGGEADWHTLALITFVVHLPIAFVEGVVLGFMVGFLARVKPEMLRWSWSAEGRAKSEQRLEVRDQKSAERRADDPGSGREERGTVLDSEQSSCNITHYSPLTTHHLLLGPALLVLLLMPSSAQAHRLDAQAFLLPGNKLQVEAWFSSGEAAQAAKVEIYSADGRFIAHGTTNEKGIFTCTIEKLESLRIVVSAGAEHRKEFSVDPADSSTSTSEAVPLAVRDSGLPFRDVLIGAGFLLALGAFFLSYRNARKLRELESR